MMSHAKKKLEKAFLEKVKGVTVEVEDQKVWAQFLTDPKVLTDPLLGKIVIDYAEGWARLMQVEIATGKTVEDCVEQTFHELGFLGKLTAHQFGFAMGILYRCWKHGGDLIDWHFEFGEQKLHKLVKK